MCNLKCGLGCLLSIQFHNFWSVCVFSRCYESLVVIFYATIWRSFFILVHSPVFNRICFIQIYAGSGALNFINAVTYNNDYSSSQKNVPFQRLYATSKLPSEFIWGYLIKRSRRSPADSGIKIEAVWVPSIARSSSLILAQRAIERFK